jgi:hypothetical protein
MQYPSPHPISLDIPDQDRDASNELSYVFSEKIVFPIVDDQRQIFLIFKAFIRAK